MYIYTVVSSDAESVVFFNTVKTECKLQKQLWSSDLVFIETCKFGADKIKQMQ